MISLALININKILLFFVILPTQLYTLFINIQHVINNSSINNQPIPKNLFNYLSKYLLNPYSTDKLSYLVIHTASAARWVKVRMGYALNS